MGQLKGGLGKALQGCPSSHTSSHQTRAIPEDPRGRETALVGSAPRVLERAPNTASREAETQDSAYLKEEAGAFRSTWAGKVLYSSPPHSKHSLSKPSLKPSKSLWCGKDSGTPLRRKARARQVSIKQCFFLRAHRHPQ